MGSHGRGNVHEVHHVPAQQLAERVCLRGQHHLRHFRTRGAYRLPTKRVFPFFDSCHLPQSPRFPSTASFISFPLPVYYETP